MTATPPAIDSMFRIILSQLPGSMSRSLEEGTPLRGAQPDSGPYAVRHNPAAYYTSLGSGCGDYDVPLGSLNARFTFVTPNLIDDMHDGTISDEDNFLGNYGLALLSTPQYQAGNTASFIVWDENSGSSGKQVPCMVISLYMHEKKTGPRTDSTRCCARRESCSGFRRSATPARLTRWLPASASDPATEQPDADG